MSRDESVDRNNNPRWTQLIEETNKFPWIFIDALGWGDMLVIKTAGTTYEMKVLDPLNRKVSITGRGEHAIATSFADLVGTILNPEDEKKLYKAGGIAVGRPIIIILTDNQFFIALETTQEVYVNDKKVLPDFNGIKKEK